MAEALWRLRSGRTRLLTAVGDDADGKYLAEIAPGLLLDGCIIKQSRTPSYAAVLDPKGECLLGLGDMTLHNHISVELVNKHMDVLEQAPLVVIDGNVPQNTMDHVLQLCHRLKKPVFFETTDRRKATKALNHKHGIIVSSPNISELRTMAKFLLPNNSVESTEDLAEILSLSEIVSQIIDIIIVTLGDKGVVTIKNSEKLLGHTEKNLIAKYYPIKALPHVENVSGAGDCFASGFIYGMLLGHKESQNVFIGFESAKQALLCKRTVPLDFKIITPIKKAEHVTYKIKN